MIHRRMKGVIIGHIRLLHREPAGRSLAAAFHRRLLHNHGTHAYTPHFGFWILDFGLLGELNPQSKIQNLKLFTRQL
jgi:hypothetical protein